MEHEVPTCICWSSVHGNCGPLVCWLCAWYLGTDGAVRSARKRATEVLRRGARACVWGFHAGGACTWSLSLQQQGVKARDLVQCASDRSDTAWSSARVGTRDSSACGGVPSSYAVRGHLMHVRGLDTLAGFFSVGKHVARAQQTVVGATVSNVDA
ncbi:hypothetical protein GUJ93_ZPchr0013g37942 [Zizania palustris]|uniref:Uncharacterized protein n=1 Tax=Zizania palustris TaxID=103762 RepID=A0A8J6C3T5_ZIZPA|nr:hypothetical protein GUJ93_ZPchr0013g37942 [Zizania palustris]